MFVMLYVYISNNVLVICDLYKMLLFTFQTQINHFTKDIIHRFNDFTYNIGSLNVVLQFKLEYYHPCNSAECYLYNIYFLSKHARRLFLL